VPGYHGEAQDEKTLADAANKIGYPVLAKASAGGGGRGMRIVRSAEELGPAIVSAKREALAAFGDDRMLIEKFVLNPRHIEVQIIGDSHGNLISLFERECTLQRRHQKVIEEAPSPTLNAAQREAVCEAARKAAGAVNYVGAGTIEFVSDGKETFFIEMNTRLQVEHPVTELITGVDLVELQLRVAFGEKLPLTQDQVTLNGHAVEARVYAENPNKNFMPSVGRIRTWRTPEEVDGLRIDAGYAEGKTVSPNYDAMLAKVIAWAPTRDLAISRLNRGLQETDVRGIVTNIPFLSALITHPDVRANTIDTSFIERELAKLTPAEAELSDLELAAAVASILQSEAAAAGSDSKSPWRASAGWAAVGARHRRFCSGRRMAPSARRRCVTGRGFHAGNRRAQARFRKFDLAARRHRSCARWCEASCDRSARWPRGLCPYPSRALRGPLDRSFGTEDEEQSGADRVVAPLPGTVVALLVEEGAAVEKGAAISRWK
jgi:3-methylcrotonyl-CoA carboxylase alpha subunit